MGPVGLIKLGGSLITDKRREKHARPKVIERLAGEIVQLRRASGHDWIVGHGSPLCGPTTFVPAWHEL